MLKLMMALCIFLVTACGQKGPLYLPGDTDKGVKTTTEQKKHGTQIYQDAWPW